MGIKLAAAMAFLMFAVGGIFYWYYTDTQERMAILNENNAKLEIAVQINEGAVKQLQVDHKKANEELGKVNNEFVDIRRQNQVLSEKLSEHDIGTLAERKPGLVEKIINTATAKANKCFELVSGAKLTNKEKEATDGKTFNSECSWLFDPYKPN